MGRTLQPEELVQRNNNTVVVHSCHLFTTPPSKIWDTPIHPIPKPESNNSWMNPVTHAQCIFYTLFKFYVTSYLYGCSPIKSSLQCFTALPLLRQKFGECRWTTLVSFKEYLQACVFTASADAPTPQHA